MTISSVPFVDGEGNTHYYQEVLTRIPQKKLFGTKIVSYLSQSHSVNGQPAPVQDETQVTFDENGNATVFIVRVTR